MVHLKGPIFADSEDQSNGIDSLSRKTLFVQLKLFSHRISATHRLLVKCIKAVCEKKKQKTRIPNRTYNILLRLTSPLTDDIFLPKSKKF